MFRRIALFLAVLLTLSAGQTFAQSTSDALVSGIETRIDNLRARLKATQAVVAEQQQTDDTLNNQKAAIDSILLDATAEGAKLRGPMSEVTAQLARIGPPPQDGTAETPALAAQRRILETRSARLAAAQKQFELLNLDAQQQMNAINLTQREQFFERIFKSEKSILNPRLWYEAGVGLWAFIGTSGRVLEESFNYARVNFNPSGLLLLPICGVIIFLLWRFSQRAMGFAGFKKIEEGAPQLSAIERLWRALLAFAGLMLFILLGVVLISVTVELAAIATPRAQTLLEFVLGILATGATNAAIIYVLCAPRSPPARLIAVDDRAARILPGLVGIAAMISELGSETPELFDSFKLPLNGLAGQSAIVALAMIIVIVLITAVIQNQARRNQAEGSSYYLAWFVRFLPAVWLLLGVAAFALLLGYIALAYFITGSILDTALFVVAIALLHSLADAFSEMLQNPLSRVGQFLRQYTGLTELGLSRIALAFRTGVDVLIVIFSIPILFVIWALTWIDLRSIFGWVYNGITIGNITLSPWGLVVAAFVFAVGVFMTRAIAGWLQRRVLSETALDKGVQDSVRTGASYLGYIIAASFALSAAGLDFSNIAIVAGALGVGIGFGLQSIVNNFVSGLILLAERPVRVGDWVVTNAGEGIVKKINVRSTEIETFDNCTVIVPNSNLITEAVRNWTHRDTIGRFGVSFIVEQQTKPQVVADILRKAATDHPKVLRYPEPIVSLVRFVNGGFEFELKGSVADVFEGGRVASDIRFVVAGELAKNKIKLQSPLRLDGKS